MAYRIAIILLFIFSTVATATTASAQQTDVQKAQQHFDRGGKYYFAGEYPEALVEFTKGYALVDNPVFLYNIALCHWRMDDYEKARATAEEAMESDELSRDVEAKVKGRFYAFGLHQTGTRVADTVDRTLAAEAALEEPTDQPAEPAALAKQEADRKGSNALLWTGVTMTVGGAGLLAGFGVIEVGLSDDIEAYKEAADRGDRAEAEALAAEIDSRATIGRVLLYSGAGLAAVGVVLMVVDLSTSKNDAAVTVSPTGDGVAASLHFRF